MIVCIEIHEGLSVTLDSDGDDYNPDQLDDMCKRASLLFNDAMFNVAMIDAQKAAQREADHDAVEP